MLGALGRTVRSNIPQTRDHPSHEVLIDDWAHGFALSQNRRINHAIKQTVLNVARRMDDAGLGRLMLGRRGKKTRFSLPNTELEAWLDAFDALSSDERASNDDRPSGAARSKPTQPADATVTVKRAPSPAAEQAATRRRADTKSGKQPPVRDEEASANKTRETEKETGPSDRPSEERETNHKPSMPDATPKKTPVIPNFERPAPPTIPLPARKSASQEPPPAEPSTPELITHRFVIRPGYTVEVNLPADFSDVEARRLARFVIALPFDMED